jgi:hypothetical protein
VIVPTAPPVHPHLGIRASLEVARVVNQVGAHLYEEVRQQRHRRVRPLRLPAARRRQRASLQPKVRPSSTRTFVKNFLGLQF